MKTNLKQEAVKMHRLQGHMGKFLERIATLATEDQREFITVHAASSEYVLLGISVLQVFFRSVFRHSSIYNTQGVTGEVQVGHFSYDTAGNLAHVVNVKLSVDEAGKISWYGRRMDNSDTVLDDLLEAVYEGLADKWSRGVLLGNGVIEPPKA